MKKFTEQLKKRAESVKLRGSDRAELRQRLVSYMEYHPLPAELQKKELMPTIAPKRFAWANFTVVSRYIGAFAMVVLVAVPVIAERSQPGDVLYPVKVQFNEEVRSNLALSPYEKVEWETTRLERRIAEARLLATEGKLTPEAEEEFAAAVKQHSDAAQKEIASIRKTNSDEAAIAELTFASALEVQSEVLEGHSQKAAFASSTGTSIVKLAEAVDEARKVAEENKSPEAASYPKLMAHLELETTRAYEYLGTVAKFASEEETSDIEARLTDIQKQVEKAANKHEAAADSTQATELLKQALTDTRKLISFMTNIDVRENVTIEELVPMSENEEEQAAGILDTLTKIDEQTAALDLASYQLTVEQITETESQLVLVGELTAHATVELEDGNLDAAEEAAEEAHAMLGTLIAALDAQKETATATTTATTTENQN